MIAPPPLKLRRASRLLGVIVLTSVVPLAGCARGCTSSRPPIHLNPSMDDQPKVLPQTASAFFFDGSSMRQPVPGTIPIGGLKEDAVFFTGKGANDQFVATIPVTMDEAGLERGRQRYVIYCQPCHDARGDGKGILFQRGSVPTATFHQEKVLKYPDGQIFDVITNGFGLMPGYKLADPSCRQVGDRRLRANAPARSAGTRRECARLRRGSHLRQRYAGQAGGHSRG